MRETKYKFEYDRDTDAAYLTLSAGRIATSEEVQPGLVIDFDNNDKVIGVEILRFSRRFRRAGRSSKVNRSSRASAA